MPITIDDFKKLEIKIGRIILAERVPSADKLLRLVCDIGTGELRQILAGIAEWYDPAMLVGKEIPLLLNLEPRTMRGLTSYGMMLAADDNGRPTLLHPATETPPGSMVK